MTDRQLVTRLGLIALLVYGWVFIAWAVVTIRRSRHA